MRPAPLPAPTRAELDALALEELGRLALAEHQARSEELAVLQVAMDLCPCPMWVKRLEQEADRPLFRVVRINGAYERRWGARRDQVEGRLDRDIWGEKLADQFALNDLRAVATAPEPLYAEERVPNQLEASTDGSLHPAGEVVEVPVWRVGKVSAEEAGHRFVVGIAWRPDELRAILDDLGAAR